VRADAPTTEQKENWSGRLTVSTIDGNHRFASDVEPTAKFHTAADAYTEQLPKRSETEICRGIGDFGALLRVRNWLRKAGIWG